MNIGGKTVTLFDRVFGGNDYNYDRTVAAIDSAIAQYGEGESVTFRYEHALDSKPLLRSVTEVVYPAVLHRLGLDDCADKLFYSTLYGEFCSFDDYVRNYLLFCYDMQVGGEE